MRVFDVLEYCSSMSRNRFAKDGLSLVTGYTYDVLRLVARLKTPNEIQFIGYIHTDVDRI